jgi:CubicO group peptidase (beta-lactamase class C family)
MRLALAAVFASACVLLASPCALAQVSLDALLQRQALAANFPALGAAVVVKGQLVAVGTAGTRRTGTQIAVTRNDRFHLGSDTKAMTALLAGMLVEEGKLKWDSTLAQVFPELEKTMDTRLQTITLTQLLSHTSGLPADNAAFGELLLKVTQMEGNLDQQRYSLLKEIAPKPLVAAPGSTFAYSNLGYIVAGAMIERATGQSWEEVIVQRLFVPLGLRTAGLGPTASMGRVDAPLGHRMVDGKLVAMLSGPEGDNPPILGPAGTAHMSVLDFASWGSWMAGQGKRAPFLVKPETFKKLVTPVAAMPLAATTSTTVAGAAQYALGWAILNMAWAETPLVFHGGSNNANKAYIWVDTQRDATVVIVTNVATPNTEDVMMKLAGQLYTAHVSGAAP